MGRTSRKNSGDSAARLLVPAQSAPTRTIVVLNEIGCMSEFTVCGKTDWVASFSETDPGWPSKYNGFIYATWKT